MLTEGSSQPQPLPRLRMSHGDVVLALARHLVASLLERGDHAGAVVDEAGGVGRETARPSGSGAVRVVRVVRPRPAVFVVQGPLQQAVGPMPAGRGDVVALARQKLPAPGQKYESGFPFANPLRNKVGRFGLLGTTVLSSSGWP